MNEDDQWPDILPTIAFNNQKQIVVSWLGYNGERYVQYSASWVGQGWSPERETGQPPIENQEMPDLPEFRSQ